MRVSSSQLFRQGLHSITERQVEVSRVQQQLSSGHQILRPSDDPVGSARLLELREQIARTIQYQDNATIAEGRLAVEETTLASAGEVLQRARVLTLQGGNAPLTDADRRSIAQEVRQLSGQLVDLANVQDGNGEYLFAGFQSRTRPFAPTATGGAVYLGDQGQRLLQIGPTRQVAVGDSGAEVFQGARGGNGSFRVSGELANSGSGTISVGSVTDSGAFTSHVYRIEFTAADTFDVIDETTSTTVLSAQPYSDGAAIQFDGVQVAVEGAPAAGDQFHLQPAPRQDLFATLDTLADALESPAVTAAQQAHLNQAMNNALADLDQGLGHLSDVRGRVGARLNALDTQREANEAFKLRMEEIVADVDGLDYAEAAMRLNEQLLVLQAAQQSFIRIQNLSLFRFLG